MFGRFPIAVALVLALTLASDARAADSIYWTSFIGHTVSHANLDGSGDGADFDTGGGTVDGPVGVVLDPASNHLYWANFTGNSIWRANLDGSGEPLQIDTTGATVNGPFGLAIDPESNSIYWANYTAHKISRANLDGTGEGSDLDTTGVTVNQPSALIIHRPSNSIGWANTGGDTVARANLDGTGEASYLTTGGAPVSAPFGLAIDASTGRMYWSNASLSSIALTQLDGTGAGVLNTGPIVAPSAIAIDPESNSLFWGSFSSNDISRTNLDGTGGASVVDTTGATMNLPLGMALLKAPGAIEAPVVSGGGEVGQELSCSTGTWAADSSIQSLFRAPERFSYQWMLEGDDIPDATEPSYTPAAAGAYSCRTTASNHAGATDQTSDAVSVAGTGGLSVAPLSRAFGSRQADAGPSPAHSLTVTNAGAADVSITGVVLQGANANQFAIVQNACIAPLEAFVGACAADVVFNPTSPGAKSATVRFDHTGPGSPMTVAVTGTATALTASLSGSTGTTGSSGSAAAAPTAGKGAFATLFSTALSADARGRVPVVLSCVGTGTCRGKIQVRTAKRVRTGRGKRKRVLALASKRYANIAAATTGTVKVRLKAKARRLLKKLGKVRVVISLRQTSAAAAALSKSKGVLHARDAPLPAWMGRGSG